MTHALGIILQISLSILGAGFMGWLGWRSLQRSADPARLVFKWLLTAAAVWVEFKVAVPMFHRGGFDGILGLGLAMSCGVVIAAVWRHAIAEMVASPITNLFDGGNVPPEKKPYYSIAMGKRSKGNYLEAVVAIREQLAKFPHDYEGIMLLARIQAEDTHDLQSAEITLNKFCDDPNAPSTQAAAAMTQLADWHLKLAQDTDGARLALERIIRRFPETQFSLAAEQRIAHLGGTAKILLDAHDRQQMAVPEGVNNIGLLDSTEFLRPKEIAPADLAAAHVKHLAAHPHDSEVREKLAVLYATEFKRLDLATLELAQLINEKRHSPKQIAGWLNLLANFQIQLGSDVATVRATLQQIVERFPDLPLGEITQRRLARIDSEFRAKKETPGVKLGVYEQNIGLKYGSPRKL